MDINAAYREVGSYRAAATLCGTTPKTVKRAVAAAEAEAAGPAPVVAHNYDAVADIVAERVAKTNGLISAKRLLPSARASGYGGSVTRQSLRGVAHPASRRPLGHRRGHNEDTEDTKRTRKGGLDGSRRQSGALRKVP
jgi:hypothetical protein